MGSFTHLEDNAVVRMGTAGSQDRLPQVVIDGAAVSDAYLLLAATQELVSLTYAVDVGVATANPTFDISVSGDDIVVTLARTGMVKATKVINSDVSDATGILTLNAITGGAAGNGAAGGLKVVITDPGPDDCNLICSMGGTNNNTLTIALGRTTTSTDSVKNTVAAIATAINNIVTNKKIDAVGSGTTSKKITLTAVSANFASGADSALTPITAQDLVDELNDAATWTDMAGVATAELFTRDAQNAGADNDGTGSVAVAVPQTAFIDPASLSGASIDHAGYTEGLVILTTGTFDPAATLEVKVQESADNVTFTDLTGATFGVLDYTSELSVLTGILRFKTTAVERYIKIVGEVTGAYAEFSAVVVLFGKQYEPQNQQTHIFAV